MRITAEMLVEKAKKNGKELTLEQAKQMLFEKLGDEELDEIAGGWTYDPVPECHVTQSNHVWKLTGNKRPGAIFGDWWMDVERKCIKCGEREWVAE